jgi:zinc protease
MRRHTYFAQFCAGLILVFAAYSQTLPQGVQKVTSVEGITEYAYPNGLHLLLFPDSSKPKLTVNVTYLVGSRHEGSGEGGMAHLLEHMLFLRTKSGRDVKKELTDHGAQWNGTTSDDRTNYFETVTASDDNLRWAIGLEAERMVNMRMEKQLLDTEMTVVRNEFEASENNPFQVLNQRVANAAYTAHSYGRSTIGNRSDIERVPIERLDAFYQKNYQPDNAVLLIAGQFDESKALALVAQTLGAIPRPQRSSNRPIRWSRHRMANVRSPCAALAITRRSWWSTTRRLPCTRITPPSRYLPRSLATSLPAGSIRLSWTTRRPCLPP